MANYSSLKNALAQVIKPNDNQEITGQIMQDALMAMINALGAGYQFAGVPTAQTDPSTPDQNVFYIAGAGTYPNFGATKVPQGSIGVFRYNGSWDYSVLDVASWADASNKLYYNTQAGNVAAKTIQADGFTLQPGGWIKIHFDNANTVDSPTLNVNNTGAHTMTFNGRTVSATNSWKAGETVAFYYDNYGVGIWRGIRLVEYPDFINVNELVGQTTPFASASAARTAIPQQNRKAGLNIAYLLSTGEETSQWVQDMFIGNDVTDWGVADNWKTIGPVSVSQNSQTGKTELLIGNIPALIVENNIEEENKNPANSNGVYSFGKAISNKSSAKKFIDGIAALGLYTNAGIIMESADRAYIEIHDMEGFSSLNYIVPDGYGVVIKGCKKDGYLIKNLTDYWTTGDVTVDVSWFEKIVFHISRLDEENMTDAEVASLRFTISVSIDNTLLSRIEKNSQDIEQVNGLISFKERKRKTFAYPGSLWNTGVPAPSDSRGSIKLYGVNGYNSITYTPPAGYKTSWRYYDSNWNQTGSSGVWLYGRQTVSLNNTPNFAIIIAKLDDTETITNDELQGFDFNITLNNGLERVLSLNPEIVSGTPRDDGTIAPNTIRASAILTNLKEYDYLHLVVPDGYYLSIRYYNDVMYYADVVDGGWLSGELNVPLNGYNNIIFNISKGASHTDTISATDIAGLNFQISVTKNYEDDGIYHSLQGLKHLHDEFFDMKDFLTKNSSSLTFADGFYTVISDIVYNVIMPNQTILPLLLSVVGYSDTDVSISAWYSEKDYRCINDVVVENRKCQYIESLMPPYVYESGAIRIKFAGGLKFKDISIKQFCKDKALNHIKVAGHLGAYLGWNDIPSFQMASRMKMDACVANIMTTADNVLVCAHNDNFIGNDGITYYISQKTLAEINELGWYDTSGPTQTMRWVRYFGGFEIPTVDKFLEICANGNMIPIFSIDLALAPNWSALHNLLTKWGFNKPNSVCFKMKGAMDTYSDKYTEVYEEFGNKVIYFCSSATQTDANLNALIALNLGDSIKVFESWAIMSDAMIETALANNIDISIYESILEESVSYPKLTTKDIRTYISKGVKWFTTDGFFSNGLNW